MAMFSLLGIDATKVTDGQKQIQSSVADLQSHLDNIVSTLSTDEALKGDQATALTEYVKASKQACKNVVSQLNNFCDKLDEVKKQYAAHDADIKKGIAKETANMTTEHQAYTGNYK